MPFGVNIEDVLGAIVAIGGSSWVAAIGFRRLVKSWMKEGVDISRVGAEKDIIESLKSEYARMSTHNTEMIISVRQLQMDILDLHQLISTLRIENINLKDEVKKLHVIISKLREMSNENGSNLPD